ncbi:Basement membrane-specific heparan sulfate proteoglycan core protein [Desmophyllum pertusum]|uniref:Basement membrane-specific heparan sulfate proteoglycan core protein n=1 Tax=Desmophyllum pertusum TaxID=174260 RepID=A0A9W9YH19_9CNID|nr:Basement membrane-specific heparan sulfate proteoglycan core protein [Desmophyllum pertusum]
MIVFISVGDFLVAGGNIVGEWVITRASQPDVLACRIQAAIGTIAILSSFFWTVYLSLYFYLTICRRISMESEKRVMMLFHGTAWGIPVIIAIIAFVQKGVGYSGDLVSSGWCWISSKQRWWEMVFWMCIAGKGWEISAYIAITVFYVLVKLHIRQEVSSGFMSGSPFLTVRSVEVAKKADHKLTFIPVVFILLRIWGTIRFFRFLACLPDCRTIGPRPALQWLEILQGIGDNSQGFANFVLFCLFTDKIRERFRLCCGHCMPVCCRTAERDPMLQSTNLFYDSFGNK